MNFEIEAREMREVYGESLIRLAETDERIVLVDADVMRADGTLPFQERFPARTFDVGVAEANMVGVAAGLAACGKIPFANTFGAFAARRCYDQIAVSVAYAGLNVKIVGFDPGIATELNGGTHMALEDAALMRAMPGMTIVEPADSTQLRLALPQVARLHGPCYMRLFRKRAPKVYGDGYAFSLGRADVLRDGRDAVVFASGLMVHKALLAAAELSGGNIDLAVVCVHTLKPLDSARVVGMAKKCGAVVTAENHSVKGGLGGAVCEELSGAFPVPVVRVGAGDRFGEVGNLDYLYGVFGLDVGDIVAAVGKAVAMKR